MPLCVHKGSEPSQPIELSAKDTEREWSPDDEVPTEREDQFVARTFACFFLATNGVIEPF